MLDNQQKTITKQRRIKAEKIFKQSIVNQSLANATFDSYEIDEKTQPQLAKAKRICKKYADNFNLIINNHYSYKGHLEQEIAPIYEYCQRS